MCACACECARHRRAGPGLGAVWALTRDVGGWSCGPCSAGPWGARLRRQLSQQPQAWGPREGADRVLGASLHLPGWPGALSPQAEPAEPGHGSPGVPGVSVGNLGAWCLPRGQAQVRGRDRLRPALAGAGRWGADLGLGMWPLSLPLPPSLALPRALGPITNRQPPQVAQALADSAMGLAHRRDPMLAQWVKNN